MKEAIKKGLLLLPAVSLWVGLFIAPLLLVFRVSLYQGGGTSGFGIGSEGGYYRPGTWTLEALHYAFTDKTMLQMLAFNLAYGFAVAFISLVIGLILSIGLCEFAGKRRQLGIFVVVLTKFANLLVIIYGLKWILSNVGPINNLLVLTHLREEPLDMLNGFFAALVGKTYLIIPYVSLILSSQLMKIDPNIILSARSLGLSPWQTYLKVRIPMSFDAIQTSLFIALVWGIGAYVSPLFLGSPDQWTLSIEIQRQVFENINYPRGAAVAVLLFCVFISVSLFLALISKKVKTWLSH